MIWIDCNQNNMYPPEGFYRSGSESHLTILFGRSWHCDLFKHNSDSGWSIFIDWPQQHGFWRHFFQFWGSNPHACVQGWCLPPYCSLASIILSLPAILWYGGGLRNHIAQTLLEFSFTWISSLKISGFTSLLSLPFTGHSRSAVATPKNSANSRQFSWTYAALSMTINLLISLYTRSEWRLRNS